MDDSPASIEILGSIGDIPPEDWDAFVPDGHPFLRHAFLASLEDSGAASTATGWRPYHLRLARGGDTLGLSPLYLKSHSFGEYVFDHGWANAYEQAGGSYYPKLQLCVPFTPVPGPRLLTKGDARARALLIQGLIQLADKTGVSGLHVTFCQAEEWDALGDAGFLKRIDHQFHWHNDGYARFDDFLAALSASKRKTIRRERRDAVKGLEIVTLSGADITEADWDAMYAFYMDTGRRKWGRPYLDRGFFSLIGERMAEDVVLMLAKRGGRPIAGALHLKSDDTLYGRYWGATEDQPFLHFELCYYRAIEYAIDHGLKRVEAGAQGGHKLMRGYMPNETYSAHWIGDPGFRQAVARFLDQERRFVQEETEELGRHAPFRKGPVSP